MRQYDVEQTTNRQSAWNIPIQEPKEQAKSLPSTLKGPSTASGSVARSESRVPIHTLAGSAGQANVRAALLQLQRYHGNQYVQRLIQRASSTEAEGDVPPEVERTIDSSRGGGQALDLGVQTQMGQALNADFSGVRVHTNAEADGLNHSLSARAFTTGQDIYFRQGEYNPGSSSGRELLAHELTHVVQQNPRTVQPQVEEDASQAGAVSGVSHALAPQMKLTVSQPGDLYEQEADRMASAIMHQEQQGHPGGGQPEVIHRQMPEEEEEMVQATYHDEQITRQMEEEEEPPV